MSCYWLRGKGRNVAVTGLTLSPTLKGDHRGEGCVGAHSPHVCLWGVCVRVHIHVLVSVCLFVCNYVHSDTGIEHMCEWCWWLPILWVVWFLPLSYPQPALILTFQSCLLI